MTATKPRILLVGWDAADWKVARPLMAAGEMPNLARLVAEGTSGNLATIHPALSPMLWTSIATGKRPPKHGIHGFVEPLPDGSGVRAITTLGRTTKAIWNILHQADLRSSVVSWWPSFPAEPIRGVMVSNQFHRAGAGPEPSAALPPGTIHPADWVDRLAEVRVTPMELPGEAIGLFAPEFARVDQGEDKRLHTLGRIIAETVTTHAAATEVLEHAEWDFAGVYYDAIDHFCHAFMGYHPPQQAKISAADFTIFGPVVANAYRYHDAMLGRLIELAGPDATVIVMSDHGFHADALRPGQIPAEAAGPAVEHRDFGLFAIRGPGIKAGETIFGASLLDITPTLLHLFGLPVGADMDGKVLVTALDDPGEVATIPSWDDVPGEAALHPAATRLDPVASAEAMRQLVDLGYVAPPGENAAATVAETVAELKYNLARSWDDAGQPDQAIPLYEELRAGDPDDQRYAERLVNALLQTGDHAGARVALDSFDATCATTAPAAEADLTRRRAAESDESLNKQHNNAAHREQFERRRLLERQSGFPAIRGLLRLRLDLAEGRLDDARRGVAHLEALFEGRDQVPSLRLAESRMRLRDDAQALVWAERALVSDPESWQALSLLARLHLRGRRPERALEAAIGSLSLVYHQPVIHHVLGRALLARGDLVGAENSFRMALTQLPGLVPAHEALARLYERRLHRPADAALHRNRALELRRRVRDRKAGRPLAPVAASLTAATVVLPRRDGAQPATPATEIVVVAGLPRSGTSMLMQLLDAGGVPALTDGQRVADADNPRGYYEFEPATRLARDASWLPDARGRVVKLALPLVQRLPRGESYRLLVIERDVREVIVSQRRMLDRLGRGGTKLSDDALAVEYLRQRERLRDWLDRRPEVAVLPVRYDAILANPHAVAAEIATFLGRPFDETAAAAAVVPTLRRQFAPATS